MRFSKKLGYVLGALAPLSLHGAAFAQDETTEMETIVVEAKRADMGDFVP